MTDGNGDEDGVELDGTLDEGSGVAEDGIALDDGSGGVLELGTDELGGVLEDGTAEDGVELDGTLELGGVLDEGTAEDGTADDGTTLDVGVG